MIALDALIFLLILSLGAVSFSYAESDVSEGGYCCHENFHCVSISKGSHHLHKTSEISSERGLRVDRANTPKYRRKNWRHWIDKDGDCQNTRHELLIAESLKPVVFKSAKNCTVTIGLWYGSYSGDIYSRASDLDIDHVVPLNWAYWHGGALWSKAKKQSFANDLENLMVVDDGLNKKKGAKGPDRWLPPLRSYQCKYIRHFDYIVNKYQLKYTVSERAFVHSKLISSTPRKVE